MSAKVFRLSSEPEELARLRAWLRAELAAERLAPRESSALVLAVGELCANSIKHAYGGRSGQPIQVSLRAFPDRLSVEVEDWGTPFDPSRYVPPDLDALPERGLGLSLAWAIADRLDFDVERERGTRWTLITYRSGRSLSGSFPGDPRPPVSSPEERPHGHRGQPLE